MKRMRLGSGWSAALALPTLVLAAACAGSDPAGPGPSPEELDDRYQQEIFAFTVQNNVAYGSAPNEQGQQETLRLDLYEPQDDPESRRAAVIWLHGGGLTHGDKGELTAYARRFARLGYVSASINYRVRETGVFDYTDPNDALGEAAKRDAQHDAQAAVRWLRANAAQIRIDPDRIAIGGYSAGGAVALLVGLRSNDPGSSGNTGQRSDVQAVIGISGSVREDYVNAGAPPMLLIHGASDTQIPAEQARVCQVAQSSGRTCQLVPVAGAGHNLLSTEEERVISEATRFLYDQMIN